MNESVTERLLDASPLREIAESLLFAGTDRIHLTYEDSTNPNGIGAIEVEPQAMSRGGYGILVVTGVSFPPGFDVEVTFDPLGTDGAEGTVKLTPNATDQAEL